jgi:hypothetical protein
MNNGMSGVGTTKRTSVAMPESHAGAERRASVMRHSNEATNTRRSPAPLEEIDHEGSAGQT